MPGTVITAVVVTGSGNHHRHRARGERLTLDVRFADDETVHRRVPTTLSSDQAVFQGFTGRPRRLAFDIAEDGSVVARLPVGREDSRATARRADAEEKAMLADAFGRIPPDPYVAALLNRTRA